MREILLAIFILCVMLFFHSEIAHALTMSNSSYYIRMGNLNSFAGKPTGSGFKLGITGGQTSPGLYSGSGYKVRAGFQYISSIIRFKFSISSTSINFGTLTPPASLTRSQILTVSNGSASGYSVTLAENNQLRNAPGGNLIQNTTCDGGSCTTTTASAWASPLTYGFGYRCDSGSDCVSGFGGTGNNTYKQVPDLSLLQSPVAVMTGLAVGRNKQATIIYKINISGTQVAGLYTNQINYVATPMF